MTTTLLTSWQVSEALLACAAAGVDNAGELTLHRVGAVPGEVAWDSCECGLLTISEGRAYPSIRFPTEGLDDATPCGAPYTVVEFLLTLVRCVPVPSEDMEPPPVTELSAAAEQLNRDRGMLKTAAWCCLQDLYNTDQIAAWTVGASETIGPQGGCAGTQLTVMVGFLNDCGC